MNKNLADSIFSLISPLTSKYIEHLNISSETFGEAIKSGKLTLENLKLTKDVILDLNHSLLLKFKINSIKLGELTITIPQLTNLMKTSVIIDLKGVGISAELPFYNQEKILFPEIKNYIDELLLKNKFEFIESLKKEIPTSLEKKNSKGFFNFDYTNLIMSVVDNIIIKISEVELNIDNIGLVKVGRFEYFNTDSKFNCAYGKFNKDNYIGFKLIKVENTSIEIFGQKSKEFLHGKDHENSKSKPELIRCLDSAIRVKIQRAAVKNSSSSIFKTDVECELKIIKCEVNIFKDYIRTLASVNDHLKILKNCWRNYETIRNNLIYHPDYTKFSHVDDNPKKSINFIKWKWVIQCVLNLNKISKLLPKSINNNQITINKIPEQFLSDHKSKIFEENMQKEFETFFPLIKSWNNYSNLNKQNSTSNELKDLKSLLLLLDSHKISEFIQPLIEEIMLDSKLKKEDKGFFNMFSLGSHKIENVGKTNNVSLSKEEKEEIMKEIKDNLNSKYLDSNNTQFKIVTEINEFNLNIYDQDNSLFNIKLHGVNLSLKILPNKTFSAEIRLGCLSSFFLKKNALCEKKMVVVQENNCKNESFALILDITNEPVFSLFQQTIKLNSVIEAFDIAVNNYLIKFFLDIISNESEQVITKQTKCISFDDFTDIGAGSVQLLACRFDINIHIKSREIRIDIEDFTNYKNPLNSSSYQEDFLSILTKDTKIYLKSDSVANNVVLINTGILSVKKIDLYYTNDRIDIINNCSSSSTLTVFEDFHLNISFNVDRKNKIIEMKFSQKSDTANYIAIYISNDLLKLIKSLQDLFQIPNRFLDSEDNMLTDSESSLPICLYKQSISDYKFTIGLQLHKADFILILPDLNRAILRISDFKTELNLNNISSFIIISEIGSIESMFSEHLGVNQSMSKSSLSKCSLLTTKIELKKDQVINIESSVDNIKINYDCGKLKEIIMKLIEILSLSRNIFIDKQTDSDYAKFLKDNKILQSFNLNLYFALKTISLNISQDLLDYYFEINGLIFSIEKRLNQINLNMEISKIFLHDLTDYPYSNNDMVNKSLLLTIEEKFIINLTSILNYETNLNIELGNPYINFVKQPMERFILFLMINIKTWHNEISKSNYQITNDVDCKKESGCDKSLCVSYFDTKSIMGKINFKINLKNIIFEIKVGHKFDDSFAMNFGRIEIRNRCLIENSNFIERKEIFYILKIDLGCNNFFISSRIKSKEKFHLLLPINLDMKILCSENFLLCELTLKKLEINIRQIDLTYLFKCLDLNFSVDDQLVIDETNKNLMRNIKKFDCNFILNTTEIKINLLENKKKEELEFNSCKEIFTTLHLNNLILNFLSRADGEYLLHDLNLKIKLIEIYYYLLDNSSKDNFDLIMSYNSEMKDNQISDLLQDQVELLIRKNTKTSNSTKVNLDLNYLKFNPRLDFLLMIKTFLENSFHDNRNEDQDTYSNKSSISIKRQGTKLIQSEMEINLKNTLLTLSTDDNQNNFDNCYYVAVIGLSIKNIKLINTNKDTDTIRKNLETIKTLAWDSANISDLTLKENFSEIFLELRSIDIFSYLGSQNAGPICKQNSQFNKRYILEQNSTDSLLVIKSSPYMHFNERFEIKESIHVLIELHRLILKLSYRDILSFVKVWNKMYREISNEEFIKRVDGLKRDRCERKYKNDPNIAASINRDTYSRGFYFENVHLLLNSYTISFILIDDQDNVYYPFLTANIDNVNNSLLIRNGEGKLKLISLSEIEILSHNYIAGEWEPVLENLRAEITYSREEDVEIDNKKVNCIDGNKTLRKELELDTLNQHKFIKSNLVINIPANNLSPVNINLSDMNISFIYTNLSSWIKKLLKEFECNSILKHHQNNLSINEIQDLPTTISNHKIKNLSGRNLLIKYGASCDYIEIFLKVDECIDLDYIPEAGKNRKITLDFGIEKENRESHLIFINQLGAQFHSINFNLPFNNLKQTNNSYLITEVTSLSKRRLITIYSPIVFYNKTDKTLLLNLINYDPLSKNDVEHLLVLDRREKQAIPYEFLTANFELHNPMTSDKSVPHKLRDILDRPDYYNKEICVGNEIYNLNRKLNKSLKNVREIKITSSYSIVNCLPCDLKIILSSSREKVVLRKSQRKLIGSISLKNSLNVCIETADFETPKGIGIALYDNFGNLDESRLEKIKFMKLERINLKTNTNFNNSLVLSYCLLKNKLLQNREIVIYSSNIFINKSNLPDLKLFYDTKREITMYKTEDSEEVLLYNNNPMEDTKFFLEINSAQSSYIDINNIKENFNLQVSCSGKNLFYEFIIQASLSSLPSLNYDSELYSYIFTIKPSVIVHNNLDNFNICICLKSDQVIYETIQNMQSLPFNFFANPGGKSSLICIKPVVFDELMDDVSDEYDWSEPFCIQNRRGLFTIPIKTRIQGSPSRKLFSITNKTIYLNFEIREENLITHLEISVADYQNSQFIIENCMSNNFDGMLEDESYVVKVSQDNDSSINSELILEGNFAIFSLDNIVAKQNSNANRILFEVFLIHNNFLSLKQSTSFKDQDLLEQIVNNTSPKIRLKFQILEEGIKKENLGENPHSQQSHLLPYPYHHEEIIPSGRRIKILFLSNGIKKTIKFMGDFNANKHNRSDYSSAANLLYHKNVFVLDLFVENLSISVISDNSYRDKKLRNYSRSEVMHILINNITSTYKKESFNWEDNKDKSEFNFSVYEIQIDNQISTSAKYPNVLKIARQENFSSNQKISRPFFNLNIFSQDFKKDKMSLIKFLTYNIEPIKVGIDVEFIEALLSFMINLFYQLNTSYISVNEVLKKRDDSKANSSSSNILTSSNYRYFANLLETSNVTLYVSISEKGLKDFLFKHLNAGSFLSSLINNLTVGETKILLSGDTVNYFLGSFNDIIEKVLMGYKQKFISKLFSIGAKGLFLGIIKIFSKEQIVPEIEPYMRLKIPRTFYGKYKQIKKYNPVHAYVSDLIKREKIKVFKNFEWNFFDCEIFEISKITKEEICLIFTTSNIILVNMSNMIPFYIVDYYSMGNIQCDLGNNQADHKIVIFFNQKVDEMDRYVIPCSEETIATRVTDLIRKAREANMDDYYSL